MQIDKEGILTGESSCKPARPFSRNGVCIGVLWSGCYRGAAVDLWELEYQFGGWGGCPSCLLLQWPNLGKGNLLWGRGLGM